MLTDVPDGWTIAREPMPGLLGLTCWRDRVITLNPDYPETVQHCTLVHELVHVERGPVLDEPGLAGREELAVRKIAARRLVNIRELGEALAESEQLAHAAELLGVDLDTLTVRLKHLHPSERAYLTRRLESDA